MAVVEQRLDGGEVTAALEQMGGDGMAEGMAAAPFVEAGAEFRLWVELLGDGDMGRRKRCAVGPTA